MWESGIKESHIPRNGRGWGDREGRSQGGLGTKVEQLSGPRRYRPPVKSRKPTTRRRWGPGAKAGVEEGPSPAARRSSHARTEVLVLLALRRMKAEEQDEERGH